MEFREVVRRRRMVRNYRPDPVDPAAVRRVLQVAQRAPSAGFTQAVYFVVIADDAKRQALALSADEDSYVARGLDPWISAAPVHIAVCISEPEYHARYQEPDKLGPDGRELEWPIPYWWVDVGASLMLLLLAAVDEDLAAGFFGTHRLEGLARILGVPEGTTPIGVVTLGHPAPDRRSGSLARGWRPLEEIVFSEQWGRAYR